MLDWIAQNKEWIFSGIGAVILTGIVGWLFKRKPPQPAVSDQPQKSADYENITSRKGGFNVEDSTGDPMRVSKVDVDQGFKVKRSHGGPSPK